MLKRPVNIPLHRDAFSTVGRILSVIAANATALLLALIAHDAIGMPPEMIREDALIAASIVITAVAGVYSLKSRRR
jgi:hypothetical protein